MNERLRFRLLEFVVLWVEPPKPDRGTWLGFIGLVALTLAAQTIFALWIMSALTPL